MLNNRLEYMDNSFKQLSEKNTFLKNKITTLKNDVVFESNIEYVKSEINSNPQIMYKRIIEVENIVKQITQENMILEENMKTIITQKIQEKMKQKAQESGPTLTLTPI